MKRFLKLFPAALAVVALASCSDNDLLTNGKSAPVAEEGDLIVTVDALEEGGVATRAFRDAQGKALVWAENDELNVYDADLYKHDVYIANAAGKFEVDGKAILTAPQYALFPGKDVVRGYWNRSDDKVYAEFAIPNIIVYDDNSEKVIDANGTVGYAANLPMWGTATKDGDQVKAHLRYLTAVLKINLKNAFGNANWLVLRTHGTYTGGVFSYDAGYDAATSAQLWGTFRAKLDATGAPNAFTDDTKTTYTEFGKVALEKGEADLITGDALYIDLRKVPSQASCIYVPVIEGLDGDLDNISLAYSATTDDDPTNPAIVWTEIGCKFPNEVFKHNKLYETSWDFELENASPNALSAMLNQYKGTGDDITFNLVKNFGITNDGSIYNAAGDIDPEGIDVAKYGYTVAIPALNDGVDVTINLTESEKNPAQVFTAWTNTPSRALIITDVDKDEPFKGTFTFNVGAYANTLTATQEFKIDLDSANVVIIGDYTSMTGAGKLSIVNAKSVTIGDGDEDNPTVLYTTATPSGLQVTDGTTVGNLGDVDNFVMAPYAYYEGGLTTTEIDTNIEIQGVGDTTTPTTGALTGDIDMTATPKGKLTLSGTPAANDDIAVDGNVTTKGNVEVALKAEGEAISGILEMQGANHDLILKSGLISQLKVDCISTAGQWEQRFVNVKLDQIVNAKSVACFPTLTTANDSYIKLTESLWSGAKITNAAYMAFTTVDATDNYVYTASQLATMALGTTAYIGADMNLNSIAWTGNKVKKTIIGADLTMTRVNANANTKYPVIRNLKLMSSNNGLFKETTGDISISNLTVSNVTAPVTAATSVIGGVLGEAKHNAALKNISVELAIEAGKTNKGVVVELNTVGGLVGQVATTKKLTLSEVSVSGSIKGYKELGGFVGKLIGNLDITKADANEKASQSTVVVESNFAPTKDMDLNFGKIGAFIGTVAKTAATDGVVRIATGTVIPSSAQVKHNSANKEYFSDVTATAGDFYTYKSNKQFMIGFSGTAATTPSTQGWTTIAIYKADFSAATTTYVEPKFGTENKRWGVTPDTDLLGTEAAIYWFQKGQPQ